MIKKYKYANNPLSLITIFASLAEISLICSLKFIDSELQYIFIWFVVGFPILLVLLFFIVLIVRPTSLYAPSDYKDEQNFMISMQSSKTKNRIKN